jgi:hypothetical protein
MMGYASTRCIAGALSHAFIKGCTSLVIATTATETRKLRYKFGCSRCGSGGSPDLPFIAGIRKVR